jgi:hypothetical protein
VILAGHPRPTGASLHTQGNTPPAAQIVIFADLPTGRHEPPLGRTAHTAAATCRYHLLLLITKFAPEPIMLASDTPF